MYNRTYNLIFATNILRILEERKLTKEKLATLSNVALGFISELTNCKANPSLRIMEQIANALEVPLATLLETTDIDKESLAILKGSHQSKIPSDYEIVSVILPAHQAFIVKKWATEAQKKIK